MIRNLGTSNRWLHIILKIYFEGTLGDVLRTSRGRIESAFWCNPLDVRLGCLFPANIRLDENVLKTSWRRLSSSSSEDVFKRLQDVFIQTNMFVLALRLQKTSSRRLGQDQYIRLGHASSKPLQDVFKRSWQELFKTFSRRLQDVLPRCLQGAFKTSSRRL